MDLANATVGQFLVPVENLEAAVPFYRDILGLQHLFAAPPQMAFFQCGQIRLLAGVLPAGQTAQRGAAIYFPVSDIHAVFQTLSERGVKFVAAPHVVQRTPSSEQWLAEFTDPDGNQLALMSQTTTSAGPVH